MFAYHRKPRQPKPQRLRYPFNVDMRSLDAPQREGISFDRHRIYSRRPFKSKAQVRRKRFIIGDRRRTNKVKARRYNPMAEYSAEKQAVDLSLWQAFQSLKLTPNHLPNYFAPSSKPQRKRRIGEARALPTLEFDELADLNQIIANLRLKHDIGEASDQ